MAKYFSENVVAGLDARLVILMDQWRDAAGIPIIPTCTVRTPEKNRALSVPTGTDSYIAKGSVADSAHLTGLAVDVACPDSQTRYKLVKAALAVGFRRIEVATAHIHVDIDESKPQDVIFLGISK